MVWIILMAGIIACPIVYLLMKRWLQGYAYKVAITPLPFLNAILVLGLLTSILVALQTIKTAMANPVDSLRTE